MGSSLRAFIDTNVILKHLSGKVDLLDIKKKFKMYINVVVFSEVFMVYLKAITGEKSFTLKHNPRLIMNKEKELYELFRLLKTFEHLEIKEDVKNIAFDFIAKFGLLPNDALILATCKFYNIKYLISFDSDLRDACKKVDITLLGDATELKNFLNP